MISNQNLRKNPLNLFVIGLLLFQFSCQNSPHKDKELVGVIGNEISSVNRATQMFSFAWLADVTAGRTPAASSTFEGISILRDTALAKIEGAIKDPNLQNIFNGFYHEPVWGPHLEVSMVGDSAVLTNNLMYMVLDSTQTSDTTRFVIGVSGTNAISHFGWFEEDFAVEETTDWVSPDNTVHGKISKGAHTGLQILLNMEPSIVDWLDVFISETELDSGIISIETTGHSLGGALSPLLALYLKERFDTTGVVVSNWSYAGPSPGNKAFAKYMENKMGMNNIHPYNNTHDVVPHAWQLDSLEGLCNIFKGFGKTCDYANWSGTIISGILTWAKEKSKRSKIDYSFAGNIQTFNGKAMPTPTSPENFCDTITKNSGHIVDVGKLKLNKSHPNIYALYLELDAVHKKCHKFGDQYLKENIEHFFVFLSELAYQHTSAYKNHFYNASQITAIEKYVQDINTTAGISQSGLILYDLLQTTNDSLSTWGTTECICQQY